MIPATFPSVDNYKNSSEMVCFPVGDITNLVRWTDYVPVKFVQQETALENVHGNDSYKSVQFLTSNSGKQAWVDYVPVYIDQDATDAWSVNNVGYIPVGQSGASLSLQFAGATKLDPRITFSRASNATRVGPTGLIEYAPHNLLTYSEQFDNAAWTGSGGVTANNILSPNGTQTGDTISTLSAGLDKTSASASVISGATLTLSVYIKTGGTVPFVRLQLWDNSANGCRVWVNNATGAVGTPVTLGTGTVVSANSVAANNGWYRISITGTIGTGSSAYFSFAGADADGSFSRTATQTYGIWGAQLNVGALQPYYPTTVKNLLGYTQEFDNAAWTKSNATVTADATTAPDGSVTAEKLVENTVNSAHEIRTTSYTPVANTTHTLTVYAKQGDRRYMRLGFPGAWGGSYGYIIFDLQSGVETYSSNAGLISSIQLVGNGWYRCRVTNTVTISTSSTAYIGINTDSTTGTTYTGDGTSGIYIWGAQLSDSASVDPYVYNPVAAPSASAYYGPRFDYDPVTLAPKGLLIEEQRTNSIYPSAFSAFQSSSGTNVWWENYAELVCTPNAAMALDGTQTAASLEISSATSGRNVRYISTVATTGTYTFSVYVKPQGTDTVFRILFAGESTLTNYISTIFSVSGNGSVTSTAVGGTAVVGAAATVTAVNNGWYRMTVCATFTSPTGATVVLYPGTYNAQTTQSSFYVWGAQLEAGSFPTSYIPTTSASVTRSADVATMVGANFSNWYNQDEGTVFSDVIFGANVATQTGIVSAYQSSSPSSNRISVRVGNTIFTSNSTQVANFNVGATANSIGKWAVVYKVNDFAQVINGGSPFTDTSGAVPVDINELEIGGVEGSSGLQLNGHIRRIAYFPRRLANTELTALTS